MAISYKTPLKVNEISYVSEDSIPNLANEHKIVKFPNASFTATCSSMNTDFIHELYHSAFKSSVAEVVIGKQQKRKHKKRRINKKWAKRYGYYDVVLTGVLQNADIGWSDEANPQHSFTLENPVVVRRESKC